MELVKAFRESVIRPVLENMAKMAKDEALKGPAVEELLLGIACHESDGLLYARQIQGPAIGPYQVEVATYGDLFKNFLLYRQRLAAAVSAWDGFSQGDPSEMAFNWYYATAVARAQLYRFPEALPAAGDLKGQAAWWKRRWNSNLGAGTVEQYIAHWNKYVVGVV